MKNPFGIVLVALAGVLVLTGTRILDRIDHLSDQVAALKTRTAAHPPRLEGAPPTSERRAPSASGAEASTGVPAASEAPSPAAAPGATDFIQAQPGARAAKKPRKKPDPPAIDPAGMDLAPERRRAIETLLKAHQLEANQIDGNATLQHLELARRTRAQLRSWLDPEQQRRFDELTLPKPDGPLTPKASALIQRDPVPYDLEVEWGGEWWPARTVELRGEARQIQFVGYGEESNEWLGPERIRPRH